MATDLPIRLTSVFDSWCITHCFKTYEEMEVWLKEKKLELKLAYQIGNYLCCIASVESLKMEKVL